MIRINEGEPSLTGNINNTITADAAKIKYVQNIKTLSNDTSIKLTWSKYSGANGYIIYLKDSNGTILKYPNGYQTPNNYLTFNNLSPNTKYTFTIKAVEKTAGKVSVSKVTDTSTYVTLTSTVSIKKSTQKYQLYNAKAGKNVFTNVTCTNKNTPGWNQSSSGLSQDAKVTGIKDEIHNCIKIQMNYQNFYMKPSDISLVSYSSSKILPTGGISQIYDVKDGYKNKYWCGCGPTSVTMLVDWEQGKNKSRNEIIADAKKQKVDILGSGYDFWNNKTGNCWGLKASGMTKLLKYETGKSIKMDAVKGSQSQAVNQIKSIIKSGHRMIAGVSPIKTWGHYVVITGYYVKNNVTHFIVADPLYSNKNITQHYTDGYKNTKYSYYSLCDYTESDMYKLLSNARNCANYAKYNNATNLAYLWYIA